MSKAIGLTAVDRMEKKCYEYVWWLSKTPWPKANKSNVLKPYCKDMIRLNQKGVTATMRPYGQALNRQSAI